MQCVHFSIKKFNPNLLVSRNQYCEKCKIESSFSCINCLRVFCYHHSHKCVMMNNLGIIYCGICGDYSFRFTMSILKRKYNIKQKILPCYAVTGIPNLGNTSYLSAVIQSIIVTYQDGLLMHPIIGCGCILCQLKEFMRCMLENQPVYVHNFLFSLVKKNSQFLTDSELDPDILMNFLSEKVPNFKTEIIKTLTCQKCQHVDVQKEEVGSFSVKIENQKNVADFNLSQINDDKSMISLKEEINNYINSKPYNHPCSSCNSKAVQISLQMKPREIFVLKIDSNVTTRYNIDWNLENLFLSAILCRENEEKEHYVAYLYRDGWIYTDNEVVKRIERVIDRPYLLFYKRK